ncbi:MAG: hypothetical protein Q4A05_08975 [Ruminococcus sp.]|nr:hypothetical protein [Ruminococcus sp.]
MRAAAACVALAALLALTACGSSANVSESEETTLPASLSRDGFDVDLTQFNANMMYGQIYDMINRPEVYEDKTVRVTGNFVYYKDKSENEYFSAFVPDAAACCSQGIEFVLDGDYTYPDDYPKTGSEITVTGTFSWYKQNNAVFCQLQHAQLVDTIPVGGNTNEG